MKRLVFLLLAGAACSSAPAARPAPAPAPAQSSASAGIIAPDGGAAAPRQAIEQFLGAARAQDLQAMALIWGSEKGPARDIVPRDQLEKRELIMQCYLAHDKFAILNDAPDKGGGHVYQVELTKGGVTRQTTIKAVQGPNGRWYANEPNLEPLRDLCARPTPG